MVIRRLASLCVVAAIALLLLAGRARRAEAQITPDCVTGCVTYSVEVTGGGSVSRVMNTGPYSVTFTVRNTGDVADTYSLTCSQTGGISCGTVTPSSVTLDPGGPPALSVPQLNGLTAAAVTSATVTVTYSVGASSGSIKLTATGVGPAPATSNATLTVTATTPPAKAGVVLRNHNRDNVDRSLCLTAGAGEAAAWSCGDLVITHSMPGYATVGRERSLTLIHNSATAYPRPPIAAAVTETGLPPNTVLVRLSVGGVVRDSAIYAGWTGGTRQVVIDFNAAGLATGAYPMQLTVQNQYSSSVSDSVVNDTLLIVNRFFGEFGAGFGIAGLEQLYFNQPVGTGLQHILWVGGDGSAKLYRKLNATTWVAPLGAFQDTLTLVSGVYTRNLRHNVKVKFGGSGVTLGRQIATINRAGHQTTFNWNAAGTRLASIQVPPTPCSACTYTFGWDGNNNLDYIQDPAGRRLEATFLLTVNDGRLNQLTDPDGNSVFFGWDGDRRIISRKSRRGNTTTYEYSLGQAVGSRVTKVTIPVGRTAGDAATAVTAFDPWNNKGLGRGTSLVAAGDTALAYTKIFGPRPGVADDASFWVNRWGAPTKIVNPLGFSTTIDRSNATWPAQVTRIIYPNQEVVAMTYGVRGNLTQVRDSTSHLGANGLPTKATTYTYPTTGPAQDSPTKVVDSTGVPTQPLVTNYAYNALGLTQQVTAPNGHVTTFGYNSLNLVNAVTEASVPTWNQTLRTEPAANLITSLAFNALGNDTSVSSPTGRRTRHVRDQFQRVTDVYDPAGHRVTYGYDQLNRPLTVTERVGATNFITQTGYDIDVVASVTDPRGAPRSWQYDKAGRQIAETDDWNHTELRFYNAAGQLDSVRQRVFEGSTGAVIRYTYDAAGRRQKMAWPARSFPPGSVPGDSVLYTYDNMDRMLTATTSGTVVNVPDTLSHPRKITRTYFARGELKSDVQSRANGTVGFRNTYTYDRLGRRTTYVIGTPANVNYSDSLTYTYKATGELNSIRMRWRGATASADSAVFWWDALGRRDSVRYSNNAFIKFAYDGDGTLRLVCGNDNVSNPSYADVLKFTYNNAAVDGEGLVTSTATTIPASPLGCSNNSTLAYTQTNGYDGRHQLAGMSRTTGEGHTYTYDGSGNMLRDDQPSVSTDFDYVMLAGHNQVERRVPSVGTVTRYLYDANGARTFECSGTSGCDPSTLTYRKYYYDGLGRMVGTDEQVPNGTTVVAPEYDPQGRLVLAPDGNADFGFDGDNIVRTKSDSSTGNIWTFVHGPGVDDPLIAHMVQLGGTGAIQLQKTAYFATDGQGRQYGVGDPVGKDMYLDGYFTVWGGKYASGTRNAASFGADRSTSSSMKQLSFFRNRFYDQQTGRWTQEDPIGVAGGVNLYQFNGNNPVMFTDPFGLHPCRHNPEKCQRTGVPTLGALVSQTLGAANDFAKNYMQMREANTKGADKYFHCKANCEAAQRGPVGAKVSEAISEAREFVDQHVFGDPPDSSEADRSANTTGRVGGRSSEIPCQLICAPHRPRGLDEKE